MVIGKKTINVVEGNMLEKYVDLGIDGIMNAANGIGPMGAGIAGAIRKYGGKAIQTDAFRVCSQLDPQPGQAYVTVPGTLRVKRIVHAVTMKEPGGPTSYDTIEKAFANAMKLAQEVGIKRLGCTALGTGVGGLNSGLVATIMFKTAKYLIENASVEIDIVFMDFDEGFTGTIRHLQDLVTATYLQGVMKGKERRM